MDKELLVRYGSGILKSDTQKKYSLVENNDVCICKFEDMC